MRIVVHNHQVGESLIHLSPEQVHYLKNVMRISVGQTVDVLVSDRALLRAQWQESGILAIEAVLDLPPRPRRQIWLYQALLKNDLWSQVVEKGTEAGISHFIPIVTDRTIVRTLNDKKLERYRKIARESSEQSRQRAVPEIHSLHALDAIEVPVNGTGLCLHPNGSAPMSLFTDTRNPVALIIGPEGGLTPQELERLSLKGFHMVSLGPWIYRAENAGIWTSLLLLHGGG